MKTIGRFNILVISVRVRLAQLNRAYKTNEEARVFFIIVHCVVCQGADVHIVYTRFAWKHQGRQNTRRWFDMQAVWRVPTYPWKLYISEPLKQVKSRIIIFITFLELVAGRGRLIALHW